MKKRIFAIILCIALALTLVSCSGDEETNSKLYYAYDLSPYIKLGDYKGLKITLYDTAATEEELDKYAQQWIESTTFYENVDKAAETGDSVNINYVGTIDGVAFEGGSAEDQDLVLGSAGYIDGFESGIVGMKAGEVKDINVTFPEDYGVEELNGKPAVFKITMNAVKTTVAGELTDEFLASHSEEYKDLASLREALRADIESQKKEYEDAQNKDSIIAKIKENSEIIELPKVEVDRNIEAIKTSFEDTYNQYTSYGMYDGSMVDFINEYTGMEVTTVDEFYKKYAEDQVTIELILAAVAKAENITAPAGEVKKLQDQYADYGFESAEQFTEEAGGIEYFEWYVIYNSTIDFLVEDTTFLDKDGNEAEYPVPTPEPTVAPTQAP